MLPLWSASDDQPYQPAHGHADNIRSAADHPGQHLERTTSLPVTHFHDASSGSDDTQVEKRSWFRSVNRPSRHERFDPEKVLPEIHCDRELKPARMPHGTSIYDLIPLLRFFRWLFHVILKRTRHPSGDTLRQKKNRQVTDSNVPLEIILVLSK